jgi:hypothetical protein
MQVNMVNETTRQVKQRKIGFSWTTLFFGWFVPLFRGDWKWCIIMFLLGFVSFGVSSIVFAFLYNKIHMNDLIEQGYKPMDELSYNALQMKGLIVPAGLALTAWTPESA